MVSCINSSRKNHDWKAVDDAMNHDLTAMIDATNHGSIAYMLTLNTSFKIYQRFHGQYKGCFHIRPQVEEEEKALQKSSSTPPPPPAKGGLEERSDFMSF